MNHKWNNNRCINCHIYREKIWPEALIKPAGSFKPINPNYSQWQYQTPTGQKTYKRPECNQPIDLVGSVTTWLELEQKHLNFLLNLQKHHNVPTVAALISCTQATINEYNQFLINQ